MSTRKKRKVEQSDAQEPDRNETHPSENELQNWTLLPDAFGAEEFERIKRHVVSCEICKVYCELVRMAEKDVESYLQTEAGLTRRQNLLDHIKSVCSSDCPCQVARDDCDVPINEIKETVAQTQSGAGKAAYPELVGPASTDDAMATDEAITLSKEGDRNNGIRCPSVPAEPTTASCVCEPRIREQLTSDILLEQFFPRRALLGSFKDRLRRNPFAKLGFAQIIDELVNREDRELVFIESGSTPALATLAATERWFADNPSSINLKVETNNFVVPFLLGGFPRIDPSVLYGANLDQGYGAYFPVSASEITLAIEGNNKSLLHVREAWKELLTRAWHFDRLFMTASRYSFIVGPFVCSPDNALLKNAFFGNGRRITVLLDGSKILSNQFLIKEWESPLSVQVFDHGGGAFTPQFIRRVFGINQAEEVQQHVVDTKWRGAEKNPCFKLGLREELIRTNGSNDDIERISTPPSWEHCVRTVLGRDGSELCVYVAEPDTPETGEDFEDTLRTVTDEANRCFEFAGSPVRIIEPRMQIARVSERSHVLLRSKDEPGIAVRIWKCQYELANHNCSSNKEELLDVRCGADDDERVLA